MISSYKKDLNIKKLLRKGEAIAFCPMLIAKDNMNTMKKIMAMLLALVMVIGMVACGEKTPDPTVAPTDAIVDATEEVIDATEAPVDETEPVEMPELSDTENILLDLFSACPAEFSVMTWKLDMNDAEAIKAFTGLDSTDGILEVSVTEPAMSSQAYSVVLAHLAEGADAEAIAAAMKEGIDPRKWICVEADSMDTAIVDDYVLFVMMSTEFAETITVEKVVDAFVALMENRVEEAPVEDATEAPADEVVDATEAPAAEAEDPTNPAEDAEAPADEATEAPAEG